jgi:hypothetical protein
MKGSDVDGICSNVGGMDEAFLQNVVQGLKGSEQLENLDVGEGII